MAGYSEVTSSRTGDALAHAEGYSALVNDLGSRQGFGAPVTGRGRPAEAAPEPGERYSEFPTIFVLPERKGTRQGKRRYPSGVAPEPGRRSEYDRVLPQHTPGSEGWDEYPGATSAAQPDRASSAPLTPPPAPPEVEEQDPSARSAEPSTTEDVVSLVANLLELKQRAAGQRESTPPSETLRRVRELADRAIGSGESLERTRIRHDFAKLGEAFDEQRQAALARTPVDNLFVAYLQGVEAQAESTFVHMATGASGALFDPVGAPLSAAREFTDALLQHMRDGASLFEAVDEVANPVFSVIERAAAANELAGEAGEAFRRGDWRAAVELARAAGAPAGAAGLTATFSAAGMLSSVRKVSKRVQDFRAKRRTGGPQGAPREQTLPVRQSRPQQEAPTAQPGSTESKPRPNGVPGSVAPLHGVPPSSSTPNGVPGRESSRNQVPGHSRLVDLNWRAPLAQWPARHSTAFPRLRVFSHEALDLASELLDGQKMREQQWAAHLMEQVPVDKRLGSAIRLRNAGGVRDVKELMTAVFEARTHPDSAVVTQVEIKEVRLANGQSVTVEQILTNAGLLRRLPDGQVRALKSTIPDIGRFDAGGLSLMEAKEPSTILRAHGHVVAEDRFRARRAPGPGFQVKSSEVALQDAEREAVRQFGLQNPGSHLVMDVTELDGTPVHDLAVPSDRVKRPHVGPYEMPVH